MPFNSYKVTKKYPQIIRIAYICKSEWACLKEEKEKYDRMIKNVLKKDVACKDFEKVEYLDKLSKAGKASYIERNIAMIDKSDYCIFYYNENYKPNVRKRAKNDISYYQPKSGTATALKYAQQKKKNIIFANNYKDCNTN